MGGGCWRKDAVEDASEFAQPIALLPGDCRTSGFGGSIQPSGAMAWTDDSDPAAAAFKFCTKVGSGTSSDEVWKSAFWRSNSLQHKQISH